MISLYRQPFAGTLGQIVVALTAALAAPAVCSQPISSVQDWPKNPITFVAPFSPGGGGDTLTRLFADQFAKGLATVFEVKLELGCARALSHSMKLGPGAWH
jgi:hypothetical protein